MRCCSLCLVCSDSLFVTGALVCCVVVLGFQYWFERIVFLMAFLVFASICNGLGLVGLCMVSWL